MAVSFHDFIFSSGGAGTVLGRDRVMVASGFGITQIPFTPGYVPISQRVVMSGSLAPSNFCVVLTWTFLMNCGSVPVIWERCVSCIIC